MATMTSEDQDVAGTGMWLLAARGASGLVSPGGAAMLDRAAEGAGIDAGSRVVELAPGFGVAARHILRRGPRTWTGVDEDPLAVDHLARTIGTAAGRRAVAAPLDGTGLDDGAATVVLADGVLGLLADDAAAAVLAEGARLLPAGGRLALVDLTPAADADPALAAGLEEVGIHVRPVERWRALAEAAGLAIVGSVTGPVDLTPAHEVGRALGPKMTMRVARGVTEESVRSAATRARQALERALPSLRSVVVVAERPLVMGLRRPR